MKPILAIDPGASGGIAFLHAIGEPAQAAGRPKTEEAIAVMIEHFAKLRPVVVMERVSGYAGREQPGSRMFNFGDGYGFLRGLIRGHGLPLKLYTPQQWQRGLGLEVKGERDKTAWKGYLANVARDKFPYLKVTLKTSDALLILDYAVKMSTVDPGFYE